MKYAFGTVVYNEALIYIDAFCESINSQTFTDYDLLIITDNLDDYEITIILSKLDKPAKVIKGIENATPARLRYQLIEHAYDLGYELLILGDADDEFMDTRIETIVETYNFNGDVAFFYNELRFLKTGKSVFKNLPIKLDRPSDLLEYNFVGLSNSAINLKKMNDKILKAISEGETNIFDWYLYSVLLSFNRCGIYVPQAVTFYRIHDNNTVGILQNQFKDFEFEYIVKLKHYTLLEDLDIIWKNALDRYKSLDLLDYYKLNELKRSNPFWWSKINIL